MTTTWTRCATTWTMALAVVLGAADGAWAQEPHPTGPPQRIETLDVTVDPLNEELLITEDAEGQLATPSSVTCSYETVQSAPNAVPTSGSFQLMYVVPVDVTPTRYMDVPRSCSDGSIRSSSVHRSSRNMASWLAAQSAGLNFRTINLTYTHNYTGTSYAQRVVRRMVSAYPRENWNNTAMVSSDGLTSPRLTKLANELYADGFNQSATKYHTLLDAGVWPKCSGTTCTYTLGAAHRSGAYGMLNRYYMDPNTGADRYHRFGCATRGDALLFHEGTHMVGAAHVSDTARDLMTPSGGGSYTFRSSSSLLWDYNRDHYHSTVRNSGYVGLSEQAGNYYTCS